MHKRLIKFTVLSPPHTGASIATTVIDVLAEWGMDRKLFCVTVDNASSNDSFVSNLKENMNKNNALVCKGEFLFMFVVVMCLT